MQGAAPSVDALGTLASVVATLSVAGAASIGSNFVDVRHGTMSVSQAVVNGLVKGAVITVMVQTIPRRSPLQVMATVTMLGGAGYLIDSVMKKRLHEIRTTPGEG